MGGGNNNDDDQDMLLGPFYAGFNELCDIKKLLTVCLWLQINGILNECLFGEQIKVDI